MVKLLIAGDFCIKNFEESFFIQQGTTFRWMISSSEDGEYLPIGRAECTSLIRRLLDA